MYVSLNNALTAGRVPWPDFARLAAKIGYGGVDVNGSAAMKQGVEATRQLLGELKLKPAVLGLPVNFQKDEEVFRRDLQSLPAMSRFAAEIGCPRMATWIMPSSEMPKAEQRAIYKRRFQEISRILAEHNVRLGLEFIGPLHLRKRFPHEFIYQMNEMLEFARECGPNMGLLLDVWHWHHAGGSLEDVLRAGKDGIVTVHVSDAPRLPPEQIVDGERLLPGEGVIDLVGFFRALKKVGYQDGLSPEVLGRGLKNIPPEDGAKLGFDTTTGVLRKAGVV